MLAHWTLDPDVTYLNHGTVGVAPKRVLAAQQLIRDEMERQPSRFLLREVVCLAGVPSEEPTRLRRSAAAIGEVDEEVRCDEFLHQLEPAWDRLDRRAAE